MTFLLFISILLIINILSFVGCMILDYIMLDEWEEVKSAFGLFLMCIPIGLFLFLLMLAIYGPVLFSRKETK